MKTVLSFFLGNGGKTKNISRCCHCVILLCVRLLDRFLFNKTNRRTNFPNLFCQETLYVSGSSSAHHQEFIQCTLGTGLQYVIQV